MSFRVKSTHKSLNLDTPEKKTVESAMSFFNPEDKVSFLTATTTSSSTPSKGNQPTRSSDGGMAVRSVPVAQADHM